MFPESREQFSLSYDLTNIIIFGGISTRSFNDTWLLNPQTNEWKKLQYDFSSLYPRFGHSSTIYERKLYVFGGRSKQSNYVYNADIEVLNLGISS
jgi:N-acetylneuraminic acid mutarotase